MKFEQLTRFARGFVYAYNGIRAAIREERNFRFHLCAALYAFVAAYWAQLPAVETALIALCVAAVLALELVNSAIERAVDKPDTTHWWTALIRLQVRRLAWPAARALWRYACSGRGWTFCGRPLPRGRHARCGFCSR